MSDTASNNKNLKEEEIDLLELLRRIGNALSIMIKAILRALLISIIFLMKKSLILGLSIAIGIGISYFLKFKSDSSYTSDLVFRNNLALMDGKNLKDNSGTTAEIIGKINKLHILCSENNLKSLSNALSLDAELVKNISDISAYWIIDQSRDGIPDYVDYKGTHNASDTINIRMQDRIDVRVKINSPQNLNLVCFGIIKFIENDSLYQQRNRLRIRQNNDLLVRFNYDLLQLDSLQKVKYFEETRNMKPKDGGQIVFMQEQKTQLLYPDIYTLYARKQAIETEQNLYKGVVTVLSDFSLPTRRDNGAMYYGKQIIPWCFFLTLFVLIILTNKKKLKETYNKY